MLSFKNQPIPHGNRDTIYTVIVGLCPQLKGSSVPHPLDTAALEAGLRLRDSRKEKPEKGRVSVCAVCCAENEEKREAETTLRHALSLGADKGVVLLRSGRTTGCEHALADFLSKIENGIVFLTGTQGPKRGRGVVPSGVASLLRTGITSKPAKNVTFPTDEDAVVVDNKDIAKKAPVVCVDARAFNPRSARLTDVLKSRKAKLEERQFNSDEEVWQDQELVGTRQTTQKERKKKLFNSIDSLVKVLKSEGHI